MVQVKYEILGDVIKDARIRAGLTVDALAERVELSSRYIYRIEDEGQKPSYDTLCKLIRELNIDPNLIFWTEKQAQANEMDELVRMLYRCDERSLAIIKATAKAALENQ